MRFMFSKSAVETVPLFNTSNVTDMYGMFQGCFELVTVPLFNTSKVTDMGYMFDMTQDTPQSEWDKAKLESIPLFDTSSVTGMLGMCKYCGRLKNIPVFADVSQVKNVYGIFFECRSVETGILSLYNKLSVLGISSYNHTVAFYNCGLNTQSGKAELAQIPDDWKEY
jgi:surface protein